MRARVLLIAAWFGVPPRLVLDLLTDDEVECLTVEALVNRAVRL